MVSLASFNANNLFLRYKFQSSYPGDQSKKSADEASEALGLGFLPGLKFRNFPRQNFIIWDADRRKMTGTVLKAGDKKLPDILCLQEVESMAAIRLFNSEILGNHYTNFMLIDGLDDRLIDVAIMSTLPIKDVRSHVDDKKDGKAIFSRDCLEATIELPDGKDLTVFINHLKSKLAMPSGGKSKKQVEKEAHEKRRLQAETVRKIVRDRFRGELDTALYCVLGDFNDTPTSPSLAPLTLNASFLHSVVDEFFDPQDRYTYYWRSKNRVSQIDYILASKALLQRIKTQANKGARPVIPREGLSFKPSAKTGDALPPKFTFFEPDETFTKDAKGKAPEPVTIDFNFARLPGIEDDPTNPVSDHAPVKVWL